MDIVKKANFYKAISQEIRLKIIICLLKESRCICHLSECLKKDQSVIFRHIQILKNAGIIETHKKKSALYCSIKDKEKMENLIR